MKKQITTQAIKQASIKHISCKQAQAQYNELEQAMIEASTIDATQYEADLLAHDAQELHIFMTTQASNKERNAYKRTQNTLKSLSTFCKSQKVSSQAFRIDEALTQFHTMKELLALKELDDCKESRVKSHISFLIHEFKHVCRYVSYIEDRKTFFKFELI
jgi:uncharacterized protein YjaZ